MGLQTITDNDIKIKESGLYKGKFSKPGHAYIIVTCRIGNSRAELAQQYKKSNYDDIGLLALKGMCVKKFREHFKI